MIIGGGPFGNKTSVNVLSTSLKFPGENGVEIASPGISTFGKTTKPTGERMRED